MINERTFPVFGPWMDYTYSSSKKGVQQPWAAISYPFPHSLTESPQDACVRHVTFEFALKINYYEMYVCTYV